MAKSDTPVEPGVAVDARGIPAVDPTANVLALVEAAVRRLDDLRAETNRRLDTELACVKEVGTLRSLHVKEISDMRAKHGEAMAIAESTRLNAIRQVDVLAVNTAAAGSLAAIQRLAETTATNADNIRTAMTATAATIAQQTANTVAAITERLAALEKSSYESGGKSAGMEKLIGVGLAVAGAVIAAAVYFK